jgi:hypothetical protein
MRLVISDLVRLPPLDLPLRCRCGHVRGVASGVSRSTGCRVLCYCKDCQAFAHFLERPDVLDSAGGTDIFQMPPGRIKITSGIDTVRCLRLGSKGIYRWYTDCCRTPIGNTVGPRFPLIGVVHCFMDHQAEGHSRDVALGPPLSRIYKSSAIGSIPPTAPGPPSFGVFIRRISKIFGWWIGGLGRPNPFFNDSTNAPCSVPRVLTQSERSGLSDAF